MQTYVITNTVNDKKYVGITSCPLAKRWREHKSAANTGVDRPLYRAMRKYGIEAFIIEKIAEAENENELKQLEIDFIEALETYLPKGKGYNLTTGGEGVNRIASLFGEAVYNSKLTEQAVIFIRSAEQLCYSNYTLVLMIRDKFNIEVSRDCVRDARRGSSWKQLNVNYPPVKSKQGLKREGISDEAKAKSRKILDEIRTKAIEVRLANWKGKRGANAKLSEETVKNIFYSTESLLKTAEKYGVSKKMVLLIKQRKTHKYLTERL